MSSKGGHRRLRSFHQGYIVHGLLLTGGVSRVQPYFPPSAMHNLNPRHSQPTMAHHARIEELSDSDDSSNPPEDDIGDALISPSNIPPPNTLQPPRAQQQSPPQQNRPINSNPPPEYKHYQCIYPLYFDASRTRAQGRRVGAELAVPNPLAREIVDAVQLLGLKTVFEPGKMHPKDWANPGRVRVLVKEDGKARNARVKNSM